MPAISTAPSADNTVPSADAITVVHDLGNLIHIASSAVNIVARDMAAGDRGVLKSALEGAKSSLDQANALVRQAIGEASTQRSDDSYLSLSDVIADLATLIRITWDQAIRLEIELPQELPFVICNRLGLQNAIMNILLNARQAMPDGGVISIRADLVPLGTATAIELRITDSGIGMTPETVARAFDPFFTTRCDGLGGIGLPIVERFVREARGRTLIESEFGIGTTVRLQLPIQPSPHP